MIEVVISKKLKQDKFDSLIKFLYSLSSEVCFTSFHQYHLDEDVAVEVLDEYRQRCKEKHHEIEKWYQKQEPFLMKTLKKLGIKKEEEFQDYKSYIYQNDMALCKKMDELLEKLNEESATRDYKEVFPSIANHFKEIEVHMYDTVSVSLMPLDLVIYYAKSEILESLLAMKSLYNPFMINKEQQVFLINPVFCNNDEAFAIIHSEKGCATIVLKEEEYEKFKALKIKHKKEIVNDEKEQQQF